MSIANEISCDVATAMLAQGEGAVEKDKKGLTDILLEVHTTLRQLTNEARQKRRDSRSVHLSAITSGNAVSGNY